MFKEIEVKLQYDYIKLQTIKKDGSEVLKKNQIKIQELRSKPGLFLVYTGIPSLCSAVKKQKYGHYFKCTHFCLKWEACGRERLVSEKQQKLIINHPLPHFARIC